MAIYRKLIIQPRLKHLKQSFGWLVIGFDLSQQKDIYLRQSPLVGFQVSMSPER
jgi:hypothetical protein